MLDQLRSYLKPPVFPGDEDKTFTAGIVHVVLWSLLLGLILYTLAASLFAFVQSDRLLTAWLYVLILGALTVALLIMLQRGQVRAAALGINIGLWTLMTIASFLYGGVVAPAYSGYLLVIVCVCVLVGWSWGLLAATVSTATGAIFLAAETNGWLPAWQANYSYGAVWSADVAYFYAVAMLVALALRSIKRASQQTRDAVIKRQKTEQALSLSEQRFRAIFDSVMAAFWM